MQSSEDKAVVKRIQEIYDDQKPKSSRAFALSINSDPSFFAKIMKGTADLANSVTQGVIEKYGVNEEWLLRGEGGKYVSHPQKKPGSVDYQARFYDAMDTIKGYNEFLQRMVESNFAAVFDRQEGNAAIIIELLKRDAFQEAGGNHEKFREILADILRRIGPSLSPKMKEGIHADGRI